MDDICFSSSSSTSLLLVLIISSWISIIHGDGVLTMKLKTFQNPGGKLSNGRCCDGTHICFSQCDHMFTICIDRVVGPSSTRRCKYGSQETGRLANANYLTFGAVVGAIKNPLYFPVDVWPGAVKVKINVYDHDEFNPDDFVAYFQRRFEDVPGTNESDARISEITFKSSRVTMTLDIKVFCNENFFGPECAVNCRAGDDENGHFSCDPSTGTKICHFGWIGTDCNTIRSNITCGDRPCKNGGICQNTTPGFRCDCPVGFSDVYCSTNDDECVSSPCYNDGTCTDLPNGYTCNCSSGWEGPTCQREIDECQSNPCKHNGTCEDARSYFLCTCQPGWEGPTCEIDMDECERLPCKNGGTCYDLGDSYNCSCVTGWEGDTCSRDVDECKIGICHSGATCTNINGSFSCLCPSGLQGPTCMAEVDECKKDPCHNSGKCTDIPGVFTCTCPEGDKLLACPGDVTNCGIHACVNGARCQDLVGLFNCTCRSGWRGEKCEIDVNECLKRPCRHGGRCGNLAGHFFCTCQAGWKGVTCGVDVDECLKQPCLNGGTCSNLAGSYKCMCPAGWTGLTCVENIDECTNHQCLNSGTCVDLMNRYSCKCRDGWEGDFCENEVDECSHNPCENGGICLDGFSSYTCTCSYGWSGTNCNKDVNECDADPCKVDRTCRNMIGSFLCECRPEWKGHVSEDKHGASGISIPYIFLNGSIQSDITDIGSKLLGFLLPEISDKRGVSLMLDASHTLTVNELTITRLEVAICQNGTLMLDGELEKLFNSFDVEKIEQVLPRSIYRGRPTADVLQTPQKESWMSENWYVVLVSTVALVLIVGLVVIAIFRKKWGRKLTISESAGGRFRRAGVRFRRLLSHSDSNGSSAFENGTYCSSDAILTEITDQSNICDNI